MRIVFMGTPDFAVASLRKLVEAGYQIVGVITAPDSDGGRKGPNISAVKRYATEQGLPVLQPTRLKNPVFLEELRALQADLQVVVAFRMLPEQVWNMPPLGTINLHGSLLPKYRGAAPINWAVMNGETETGVTTFKLKQEIDTGDVYFRDTIAIGPNDTAGEVHDRLMAVGADLVLKTVQAIESGNVKPIPQLDVEASHAPKIFTETCHIDLSRSTKEVHNFIRGLSPYPGACLKLNGKMVKILKALTSTQAYDELSSGQLKSNMRDELVVGTANGAIQILELQLEGKKRIPINEFLNGWREPLLVME